MSTATLSEVSKLRDRIVRPGIAWRADEVELIKLRYRPAGSNRPDGWPVEKIAAHLGRSKNSIVGKAKRLGLAKSHPRRR